jgi:hypothetical protein
VSELTFKIGAFNADTRSVPVTFTSGDIVHKRDVNAVLKADGSYDKTATRTRVEEVALGVKHKIDAGVIAVPAPEPASAENTAASA